jgi:uncharacterized protein YciW
MDVMSRQQANRLAQVFELARPVMSRPARLQENRRRRSLREIGQ